MSSGIDMAVFIIQWYNPGYTFVNHPYHHYLGERCGSPAASVRAVWSDRWFENFQVSVLSIATVLEISCLAASRSFLDTRRLLNGRRCFHHSGEDVSVSFLLWAMMISCSASGSHGDKFHQIINYLFDLERQR